MTILRDLWRLFALAATIGRTGASERVFDALGLSGLRRRLLAALLWPIAPFGFKGDDSLPPIARALTAMGPSYVKFGQIFSTRPDVVGDAIARDLRTLQDRLPPFGQAEAVKIVEREFDAPVEKLFLRFDPPIAAASIAQVHPAVDRQGRRVAVKVLRPGVERAFARDISAFRLVARVLERVAPKSRRLRPKDIVDHFEGVVTKEMDLRLEAAAGSEYRENTADEPGFRTPEVFWPLTTKRVLTTAWVDGAPMGDPTAVAAIVGDLPELARRLVRVFLRTALRDGYFHADMHQGNLKLGPDGAIVAFDFGIMGRIDPNTRRTYAEILFSFLTRDYARGAQAHFDAGYVDRRHDPAQFALALRSIGEPIVGRDAATISMARVLQQLFEVTERFGMRTRPELILLQRTMVVVEGVARSLDENFNMWDAAGPEVERWMAENLGPQAALRDAGAAFAALNRIRPRLPELAERLVEAADRLAEPPGASAPRRDGFWRGVGVGAAAVGGVVATVWLFSRLVV